MTETDLSLPVMRWLWDHGYTPYAEVPYFESSIDIIGLGADRLVAVELKLSLTKQVIYQANRARSSCDASYVAIASEPRKSSISKCRQLGVGVLVPRNGRMAEIRRPTWGAPAERWRNIIMAVLADRPPGGIAGQPTMKGNGPAQECWRRITAYRQTHPDATWRELFENVRNHYAHHRSMQGALRWLAERAGVSIRGGVA